LTFCVTRIPTHLWTSGGGTVFFRHARAYPSKPSPDQAPGALRDPPREEPGCNPHGRREGGPTLRALPVTRRCAGPGNPPGRTGRHGPRARGMGDRLALRGGMPRGPGRTAWVAGRTALLAAPRGRRGRGIGTLARRGRARTIPASCPPRAAAGGPIAYPTPGGPGVGLPRVPAGRGREGDAGEAVPRALGTRRTTRLPGPGSSGRGVLRLQLRRVVHHTGVREYAGRRRAVPHAASRQPA